MTVPERFRVGITRCRREDAEELRAFQERMYGEGARQLDRERFRWLQERNPARSEEGLGLWVCRRDGELVGQQAEIPFDLRIGGPGGPTRRAAWAVDLMVDPAWRIKGVGPGLMATQLDGRELVGGLNLSDKGRQTYLRAGWTDLGVVPVYLRPLDAGRALRLAPVPPAARRAAPLVAAVVRGTDAVLAAGARAAGLKLAPVERFDGRTDEVWAAALADYRVLAVRDAATNRWRLDERPDAARLRRAYMTWRGRTLGYVALRLTTWSDEPAAVVVDYLAPAAWVAPLLTLTALWARRQGAIALVCKTRNEPADRALRAAGFVRREQGADPPIRFMFHCADDDPGAALVRDPAAWFVTSADSDLEYATTPADEGARGAAAAAGVVG